MIWASQKLNFGAYFFFIQKVFIKQKNTFDKHNNTKKEKQHAHINNSITENQHLYAQQAGDFTPQLP